MFQRDYLLRQIEACSNVIGKVIFRKDFTNLDADYENMVIVVEDDLKSVLQKYISESNINEGEEVLFDYVKQNPTQEHFDIAMDFYRQLSEMEDQQLLSCNFSKEEILQGINDIKKIFVGHI